MLKYYTFKKGQHVPQWLLDVTDGNGCYIGGRAMFMTRGKIALNTETGATIMWPATRNHKCIIELCISKSAGPISAAFHEAGNTIICPDRNNRLTPLASARRMGYKYYTSTKCEPLPDSKP